MSGKVRRPTPREWNAWWIKLWCFVQEVGNVKQFRSALKEMLERVKDNPDDDQHDRNINDIQITYLFQ